MDKLRGYFFDIETGKPKWAMIGIVTAFVGFLLWYYFFVANFTPKAICNDNGTPISGSQNTNNGNNGNNGGGGSDPINGNASGEQSVITDLQAFTKVLHETINKSYNVFTGCGGNDLPGERCWNFKEFLKMSTEQQRTIAEIYQSKFSKSLLEDLGSIYICDCSEWKGTLTGKMKDRLKQLGYK